MKFRIKVWAILFTINLLCVQNMALANDGYQKKLKEYLLGTQSLEGNYTQILYSKNNKKMAETHGYIMYKKPNLFHFQDSVNHQIVVNDGQYLWQFDPDLEQVIKYKAHGASVYALLNDLNKIYVFYDVTAKSLDNKNIKYKLINKNDPQKIFWIHLAQGELATVEFYDATGYFNVISFSHLMHNQDISSKWFDFHVDPEIDVIEQ